MMSMAGRKGSMQFNRGFLWGERPAGRLTDLVKAQFPCRLSGLPLDLDCAQQGGRLEMLPKY
jgi:hypothetical protein